MPVDLKAVKSRNISHVGYDPAAKELHVRFHTGPIYIHENVAPDQHSAMMAAESVGKHYAATFRGNDKHPSRPAEAPPK